MQSSFEPEFEKFSKKLPPDVRKKAHKAFKNFRKNDQPDFSRGLEFKRIKGSKTLHSIRINDNYRALGHKYGDVLHWYWIGPHDEYICRIRGQ